MTEITRVPLQPIAKGTLSKLWAGVLAAALAAAALAWFTLPPGVKITTIKDGAGAVPKAGDLVFIKYVGKLASNGKEFDRSRNVLEGLPPGIPPGLIPEGSPFEIGQTVPGFNEALQKVQKGGKYTFMIPAEKAYGAEEKRNPQTGEVEIPANSDLVFDVEVTEILSPEEAKKRSEQISAIMAQLQPSGPPAPDGAAPEGEPAAKPAPKAADKK
ncbi:MAG: FKBP-type peptidyl-prolyl cis-trans isomerase [Novosphingobium sp.]|uniref:FKBP-type peptidyl-prolyl cis-trans isomerase n=1 Tax=Novosphingobium sp. TaxID=1874826 RepID=UPI003C7BE943